MIEQPSAMSRAKEIICELFFFIMNHALCIMHRIVHRALPTANCQLPPANSADPPATSSPSSEKSFRRVRDTRQK
jgi:hypothetical protein